MLRIVVFILNYMFMFVCLFIDTFFFFMCIRFAGFLSKCCWCLHIVADSVLFCTRFNLMRHIMHPKCVRTRYLQKTYRKIILSIQDDEDKHIYYKESFSSSIPKNTCHGDKICLNVLFLNKIRHTFFRCTRIWNRSIIQILSIISY